MSVKIYCSTCDAPMRVSESLYGRRVRCETCGAVNRVTEEEEVRAPAAVRTRRRKKSNASSGNTAWIVGGAALGLVLLIGLGAGIALLARADLGLSLPDWSSGSSTASWVNVSLPEGITFSSPKELVALPQSPLPNGKAYGCEVTRAAVGVLTMPLPGNALGNSVPEMLQRFEANLRNNDPQTIIKNLQVDGQPVLEVERVDPKSKIRGWVRISIINNQFIALIVANDIRNRSTTLRDQVFASMHLPAQASPMAVAGVAAMPAGASSHQFSRLQGFFGGAPSPAGPSMPSSQIPGGMAGGPPQMPALPEMTAPPPIGGIAGGQLPGGIPNPGGAAGSAIPPGVPGRPTMPNLPSIRGPMIPGGAIPGAPPGFPGGGAAPGVMPRGAAGAPGGVPGAPPGARP